MNNITNLDSNIIINSLLRELENIETIEKERLRIESERLELLKEFKRKYYYHHNWQ